MSEKKGIASFAVGFGNAPGNRPSEQDDEVVEEKPVFRIVFIDELAGNDEHRSSAPPSLEARPVDRFSFDARVSEIAPAIVLEVADPFDGSAPPLRVDGRFSELRSFRPDGMIAAFPLLRSLDDARKVLAGVTEGRQSVENARATLRRALPRPHWVDAILANAAPAHAASTNAASAPARAPEKGGSSLDALFDKVEIGGPSAPLPSPSSIVSALVSGASRSSSPSIAGSRTADKALAVLIQSILAHPSVRSLERAFRALKLLVDRTDPRSGVEVDLIACSVDEIETALAKLAERSGGESLRAPIDLIVIGARVDDSARDLQRLNAWADQAALLRAPIVVPASTRLLGFDSVEALSRSSRKLEIQSAGLRGLCARDEARFVVLTLNDILVRLAYDPATARLRDLEIREDQSLALFAPSSVAIAILSAQSFVRTRFGASIIGPRHGLVPDLPVHELSLEGQSYALCLEALVAIDTQHRVGDVGFALLGCAPNQDSAVLLRAPTLYRGEDAAKLGIPGPEAPLGDQMFATRLSQAVDQVAAAIPRGADPKAVCEVAIMTVASLFTNAATTPGRAPETSATLEGDRLMVTVKPHGHAGATFEEVTVGARLA